jgi:hypothetical protein
VQFNLKMILRILLVLSCGAITKIEPAEYDRLQPQQLYAHSNPTSPNEWVKKVIAYHSPLDTDNAEVDQIVRRITNENEFFIKHLHDIYYSNDNTNSSIMQIPLPKTIYTIIEQVTEDKELKPHRLNNKTVKIPLTFAVGTLLVLIGYKTYRYFKN